MLFYLLAIEYIVNCNMVISRLESKTERPLVHHLSRSEDRDDSPQVAGDKALALAYKGQLYISRPLSSIWCQLDLEPDKSLTHTAGGFSRRRSRLPHDKGAQNEAGH